MNQRLSILTLVFAVGVLACGAQARGPSDRQAVAVAETTGVDSDLVRSVRSVLYPRPEHAGKPWSSWGQGVVLPDGRYLSGIGDHLGADGNSYLYVYDPASEELIRFADLMGVLDQPAGHWGYGKLHSQMVRAGDGDIYFASYRGNRRGIRFDDVYSGDYLFRLDPVSLQIEPVLVPVPGSGVPSIAVSPDGSTLYGEAVAPDGTSTFFVFDVARQEVTHRVQHPDHAILRAILVTADGSVFVATGDDRMLRYDGGELVFHDAPLPAPQLRAVTGPAASGSSYGVTRRPRIFFEMDGGGGIRAIGESPAYTAALALSPKEDGLYYLPDAHGGAWKRQAPLVEVNLATGDQRTILELDPIARERHGLKVGGTYSIAVDPDAGRIFVTVNLGPEDEETAFGEVGLFVLELR